MFGAVDQNAVMRTEMKRQAESQEIKINSLIKVGERSEEVRNDLKARDRVKDARIAELQLALDSIEKVEPLDEYCRPGCRPSLADKIGK